MDALRTLHGAAPQHVPTFELLTSAYVQREDWNSLVELLQAKPAQQRSDAEQLQLAKILIKAQRFAEAYELSNAVLQKAGPQAEEETAWLAAYAAFHTGHPTRAAEILDAHFESMIAAGRLDAYVVRALIHFQEGEFKQAESLLTTLLDKNASHAPAHDALGRVLVASGDVERGRYHIERASELRDQLTQTEQRSFRLSAMSQSLKAAWGRKDYDTCDRLISAMLEDASPQQQVKLYQNLAACVPRKAANRRRWRPWSVPNNFPRSHHNEAIAPLGHARTHDPRAACVLHKMRESDRDTDPAPREQTRANAARAEDPATAQFVTPVTAANEHVETRLRFERAADDTDLEFLHVAGTSAEKYMPETMGGGVIIADFNRDAAPDVLFVNSGRILKSKRIEPAAPAVYQPGTWNLHRSNHRVARGESRLRDGRSGGRLR